jgi:hypothetical protein
VPAAQLTLDLRGPLDLVRGQTTTLTPKVFSEAGTEITPTSWTGTLSRGGQTLLTGSGGATAASLALAIPSTYVLADDYEVTWAIVTASGRLDARHVACVCRSQLYPTLTATEIYARAPALNPSAAEPLRIFGSGESVLTVAAEAWRDVLQALYDRGVRPRLILSPESLRGVHLARTMHLLYQSCYASAGDDRYATLAATYAADYAAAWQTLSLRQGAPDPADGTGSAATAAAPILGGAWGDQAGRYTGEPSRYGRRYRRTVTPDPWSRP